MKHKHLYIEADGHWGDSTRIYIVWVGTSKQDNRDYLFLVGHATANNYFFEAWSERVSEMWSHILHDDDLPQPISLSARDLVRHIKAGTRPQLDEHQVKNLHYQRSLLDANYFFSNRLAEKNRCQDVVT